MRFYGLLSHLFPGSFAAKIYFVACVGAMAPLIAGVLSEVALAGADAVSRTAWFLLAATSVSTLGTLLALRAVLRPLLVVAERLSTWDEVGHGGDLPESYKDEMGVLMHQANRLMDRATARVEHIRVQAEVDPLTGALNRRGVVRWLSSAKAGWLLQFDIDDFKAVNDRWGHEKGDCVLREIVQAIRCELRSQDMLARFGGDEFVAVLSDVDAAEAGVVAERIRKAVEAEVRVGDQSLTLSIGLVCYEGGLDLADALAKADEALYQAKRRGRNCVCWASGTAVPVPAT